MSDKIRIVYFVTSLESGGTERQLASLLEGLNNDVYEKHVICLSGFGVLEEQFRAATTSITDLRYARLRHNGRFVWKNLFSAFASIGRLYRLLRTIKPDILHTLIPVCNVMGAFAGKLASVPVLISSRLSLGNYRDKNKLFAKLEDITDSWFTFIHCKSLGIRNDVMEREPVDPDRLRVIYNGIHLGKYNVSFNRQHLLTEFEIGGHEPVIGMVANLKEYKGYEQMLEAMPSILQIHSDAKLLIVGRDDGIRPALEKLAEKGGITHSVVFAGERQDVPKLLQLMNVLVSASHEEGFSNTILEAMASNLPVVATHVGGNVEQVVDNVTGLLIPPRDTQALSEAVVKLLNDPDWANKLGRVGYARVAGNFSQGAVLEQMQQLYLEAIELEMPAG